MRLLSYGRRVRERERERGQRVIRTHTYVADGRVRYAPLRCGAYCRHVTRRANDDRDGDGGGGGGD